MEQVDWIPPLVMLGIGVAVAAVLIWRAARSPRALAPPERIEDVLDVRDERARLEALIAQLRELDDLASERTPEQLAAEKRALELEAARALRDLELRSEVPAVAAAEAVGGAAGRAEVPSEGVATGGSALRGFLWGSVMVVAVAALVFFVTRTASERGAGESATGGGMAEVPATATVMDLAELRQAVERDPEDIAARLDLARALLIGRDFQGVMEQTEAVLEKSPEEPLALSYQAVVRVTRGERDRALEMAQRAVGRGGDQIETWVYLAVVHAQRGEQAAAVTVLEQAKQRFPNDAPALDTLLAELRGVPADAVPPRREPEAPAGGVAVEVQLDPAAGSRSGTLFVFARPAGEAAGEAVAVRRTSARAFPAVVELRSADAMSGTLPDPMRIDARLDADGDPATVGPDDLSGVAEDVRPGSVARLTLRRP